MCVAALLNSFAACVAFAAAVVYEHAPLVVDDGNRGPDASSLLQIQRNTTAAEAFEEDVRESVIVQSSHGGFPRGLRPPRSHEQGSLQNATTQKSAPNSGRPVSHEYCDSAFKQQAHVFHGLWSTEGWTGSSFAFANGKYNQKCWNGLHMDKVSYLEAVQKRDVAGYSCHRNWVAPFPPQEFNGSTSMVLGMDPDLNWTTDFVYLPNMHRLKLYGQFGMDKWNMCRNLEFIVCGAMGELIKQDGHSILLATSPLEVWPDDITADLQAAFTSGEIIFEDPSVLYLLELCLLDQLCSNRDEIFKTPKGGRVQCQFDESGFESLKQYL